MEGDIKKIEYRGATVHQKNFFFLDKVSHPLGFLDQMSQWQIVY